MRYLLAVLFALLTVTAAEAQATYQRTTETWYGSPPPQSAPPTVYYAPPPVQTTVYRTVYVPMRTYAPMATYGGVMSYGIGLPARSPTIIHEHRAALLPWNRVNRTTIIP